MSAARFCRWPGRRARTVVPPAAAVVSHEPAGVLLARFGGWLSRERGLAPPTVSSYLHQARPFADACAGQIGVLTAARVSDLATAGALGLRPRSAQVRANAVRALLRFSWLEGLTAVPLAATLQIVIQELSKERRAKVAAARAALPPATTP